MKPVLPSYRHSTLADLAPSIGHCLGRPDPDVLGLPAADRYVVLLVDGLGSTIVADWADLLPTLHSFDLRSITCCVPSTTATSVTSLGTGLSPGQHGVAGYVFRYAGDLLNALSWREGVHGLDVQPQLTYLERLTRDGVSVTSVMPSRFRGSGLTTCALRGPRFLDVSDETDLEQRLDLTLEGVNTGERNLTYVYEGRLDHAGHPHGVGSEPWLAQLRWVERLVSALRSALPEDVRLIVTGDHGMVNVPHARKVVIEQDSRLTAGVGLIGGEPRLRQLYVRPGQAEAVAQRWAEVLGGRAWVRTREQAVAEGWFGEVSPRLADRFGDVLAACRDDHALMSLTEPKELDLVGMHGSLTEAEMFVPLAIG